MTHANVKRAHKRAPRGHGVLARALGARSSRVRSAPAVWPCAACSAATVAAASAAADSIGQRKAVFATRACKQADSACLPDGGIFDDAAVSRGRCGRCALKHDAGVDTKQGIRS